MYVYMYRKIPTQRPPPSKRPPPFSAPKVLQRGHISSCNRPERLFLGTCRLTLYEKCSVMVTFLFHQLSCQMSSRAIAHPLVSGALNAKRPWAIGRDFTVLRYMCVYTEQNRKYCFHQRRYALVPNKHSKETILYRRRENGQRMSRHVTIGKIDLGDKRRRTYKRKSVSMSTVLSCSNMRGHDVAKSDLWLCTTRRKVNQVTEIAKCKAQCHYSLSTVVVANLIHYLPSLKVFFKVRWTVSELFC